MGASIACLGCLSLAVMLIIEVITTSFFAYSQPWAVEYSGYILAAILFTGSGWTLGQGGHIRVNVLLQILDAQTLRIVDLMMSLVALLLVLYVSSTLIENTFRSLELGSVSYYPTRTPLWIPQAILASGWVMLCIGLLSRSLRLIFGLPPDKAE
jgi:TRAP-type mannitol/chloroaromatic compound transport system permease small subunit